jgi:spore maturation protein CgeB
MKILVVGPLLGGSLPIARAIARALGNVGCEVSYLDYTSHAGELARVKASGEQSAIATFLSNLQARLLEEVSGVRPDILLGIAQAPLYDTHLLQSFRKAGILTGFWFVEDFRVFSYWRQIAPHFHVFFTIQKDPFWNELKQIGAGNYHYLPLAFDKNLTEHPVWGFSDANVSFMGAPYPNRVRLFQTITGFGLKIYGEGWDQAPIPGVALGERRITQSEARWIYRNSRINLNLHSSMEPHRMGGDFVNPRTFELAGLGCFQLIDRRALLPLHYIRGREIVEFHDEVELTAMVNYFLNHPDARVTITENARRRTFQEHLYEHRANEILERFRCL